jgi:hypothetical protein
MNKQKFNAKAPKAPKDRQDTMHALALPDAAGDNQPSVNRQPVFNPESWRSFFASSRLGVAPLVIHPMARLFSSSRFRV